MFRLAVEERQTFRNGSDCLQARQVFVIVLAASYHDFPDSRSLEQWFRDCLEAKKRHHIALTLTALGFQLWVPWLRANLHQATYSWSLATKSLMQHIIVTADLGSTS